jgi:hypothetical protein
MVVVVSVSITILALIDFFQVVLVNDYWFWPNAHLNPSDISIHVNYSSALPSVRPLRHQHLLLKQLVLHNFVLFAHDSMLRYLSQKFLSLESCVSWVFYEYAVACFHKGLVPHKYNILTNPLDNTFLVVKAALFVCDSYYIVMLQ